MESDHRHMVSPALPQRRAFQRNRTIDIEQSQGGILAGGDARTTLRQYDRYANFPADRLKRTRQGYNKIDDFIVRFAKSGGIIRAGSDPNNGLPGLGVHEEMVMFVEAGLTPMQAVQAATINVAKAFRKDTDFGTLEPGKVADLIAVEGDPLKDMWTVRNVKLVVLNGQVVDSDFHADYRNPIPNIRPWRATPRDIEISPRAIAQGSTATIKVSARRGF